MWRLQAQCTLHGNLISDCRPLKLLSELLAVLGDRESNDAEMEVEAAKPSKKHGVGHRGCWIFK